MLRHFSIVARENAVSVRVASLPEKLVPAANSVEKVHRAVLYEQLNAGKRRLVFRPTRAHLINPYAPPKHNGKPLEATQYLGVPSKADYSAFIAAGEPLEVVESLYQCSQHKTTAHNLRSHHISELLRRSAELGSFTEVWHFVQVHDWLKKFVDAEVYLEALRLTALQVPSLSKDARSKLYQLAKKAPQDVRTKVALLYGLSQYTARDVSSEVEVLKSEVSGSAAGLDGVDAAFAAATGLQEASDGVELFSVPVTPRAPAEAQAEAELEAAA